MATTSTVYLNGEFLPAGEAKVSVLDRGFLFADGVYEVIPVYGGRLFRLPHHLDRLDHSLAGIQLVNPLGHAQWQVILQTLVEKNTGGDQSLYLQITRGVSERNHAFPQDTPPTVFAMSSPVKDVPAAVREGISAISVEDIRWKLCNIKSIALLPNILLYQQAVEQGAAEAIMLRNGEVTEAAAANVFIVSDGVLLTPPKSHMLLPGITRDLVVEICRSHAIPYREQAISRAELQQADEICLSSSTREIIPVTRLDGVPVGNGKPGPMWQRLIALYQAYKQAVRDGEVS